ncbi:Stress response protein nst1 [Talaromyces islandicus]|uniref:Stress response protein NST1 n=1 Tax=Talaromyces islandicus TaxID=28573 RepID=A0A0U1LUD2_TALIS|nr:Stress response protein nst1 [Talaromyces islandicus]
MAPPVNRKKAKRRQKQAARLVSEQESHNDTSSAGVSEPHQHTGKDYSDIDDGELYDHEDNDDEAYENTASMPNGTDSKSKKKKKSKARSASKDTVDDSPISPPASINPSQPPFPQISKDHPAEKGPKERIWNTSTQEERENIKKFWLELGEDERRALVKVEKDAVLKKMKEQQKHSCSCTVCGRKRTAIEEELEVLYDAYYEELEQYANHNQGAFQNGTSIVPPPRLMHHNLHHLDRHHTHIHHHHHPSHGRVHELPEDEDDLEDDYDDEEDDEEPYSDDELDDDDSRGERADFFAFGNSLTVKDGILTVADDLLKNDGKHFIDMMEQLAERRMQREEDTQYGMAAAHQSLHAGHNHGPLDEDDYEEDDEEDDGPYGSEEEEEYEDDDMDTMTEEQRMEEGRRMFQIFAARMFEQRVLTAYREKVAQQRQELLLQELLEEETLNEQRTAKKAREAQKKKDKKRQQKQAREEERARREAEKAAEEAAARALEEKKQEEQRRKKEELRKKKEAEKKQQEEERLRKEAEKQKRLQEERERHAEAERKKERERKKRDDAKRKEREEREAREKELREKKAKQERDRKAREEQQKQSSDPATKPEQGAKDRIQSQPSQPAAPGAKRMSQSGPGMIPMPPGLQHPHGAPAANSPHFQVATPIIPKAPTPARPRQPSQQGSHASSPRSQAASGTEPLASISPQTIPMSQSSGTPTSSSGKLGLAQQPILHHPQPSAPLSPLGGAGRSHPLGYPSMNGLPSHPPPGMAGIPTRPLGNENMPLYPPPSGPVGGQYRGFPGPNGVMLPPGIGAGRSMPGPGRGFPMDAGHNLAFSGQPPVPGVMTATHSVGRPQGHSRQTSGSYDRSPLDGQTMNAPISRPTPIKRPSSPQKIDGKTNHSEVDDLSAQLGSSALLEESDIPFTANLSQSLPGPPVPGGFGLSRASFGASPLFADPLSPPKQPSFSGPGNTWGVQAPFGAPFAGSWGAPTGGGWPNRAFGTGGNHRTHTSRPVAVRLLVIQAIKSLNSMSPSKSAPGFHPASRLLQQVEQLKPPNEPSIQLNEMLDICDTEGNPQNGGGSFIVKEDDSHNRYVKFEPDSNSPMANHRVGLAPGDIGSPIPVSSIPATFGGIGTGPSARQFSPPTSF